MVQRATQQPKRWQKGHLITHQRLNVLVDFVTLAARGVVPVQQLTAGKASTVPKTAQFKIAQIFDNYLRCNSFDGIATGEADIFVARPSLLRGSVESHNGVTFTAYTSNSTSRTATKGSDTETQVIVPAYVKDDVIFASNNIVGGTTVTRTESGATIDVFWQDLNVDGRMWAKVPT